MARAAGLVLSAAARRLVHDLKEVNEHPVPNVSALPLDDDLFTWHGNVRASPESTLAGAPIHFILQFPQDYPSSQPTIWLLQPLPHPNVARQGGIEVLNVRSSAVGCSSSSSAAASLATHVPRPLPREARWRLAMWDCIPGHNSWSSAYSVLSVLLQLQVFLLDEDLTYDTQRTTPQQAIATATSLTCPHCHHSGAHSASVHPPFPTQQQLEAALTQRPKLAVTKPFVPARSRATVEQLRHHQRPALSPAAASTTPALTGNRSPSPCPSVVSSSVAGHSPGSSSSRGSSTSVVSSPVASPASSRPVSSAGSPAPAAVAAQAAAGGDDDGWTTVQHRQHPVSHRGGYSGRGRGAGRGAGRDAGRGGMLPGMASAGVSRGGRGVGRGRGGRGSHAHTPSSSNSGGAAVHPCTHPPQTPGKQQQSPVVTGGGFAALLAAPAAAAATISASSQQQQGPVAVVGAAAAPALTKAAKKNAARKARCQQQAAVDTSSSAAAAAAAGAGAAAAPPSQPKMQQQQQQQQQDDWVDVKKPPKASLAPPPANTLPAQLQHLLQQPMQQLVAAAKAGTALQQPTTTDAADSSTSSSNSQLSCPPPPPPSAAAAAAAADDAAAQLAAAGPFGLLGRDALLEVCCLLAPADVAVLGQTCRALAAAVEDGAVWQVMLAKAYPRHKLRASNMTEWKAAFQLESACILDELRCWLIHAGPEEDVLGLPLTFTQNPATKKVDYILAHPDVLSVTAFKVGVRVTPQGEKFDALLPLYLTADHFNRALPHMAHLLPLLAPELVGRGGSPPPAAAWLEVLPKILNTQVVLLSDNGLSVSQRSLSVYSQVHRLLLAVCEHWALWSAVSHKLDLFANSPASRTKKGTPNLGLLLPLLAVGNPTRHSWGGKLADAILQESLSRGVLWMCKRDPSLVERFRTAKGSGADPELVAGSWQGASVSAKLISFHVAFLKLVACPRGATLESVMDSADALYGAPPAGLSGRFRGVVARIQQLSSWREYYVLLGRQAPNDAALSDLLRWAWAAGAAKGYHSADTDFSRVQASGVSTILLKGQSYSMPPSAKSVDLSVHYKWRPEVFVRYLDGAVLLMGPGRQLLEMVAWNHQSSSRTARPGAVTHSGDIMEFDQQQGANHAHIDFGGLGPAVEEVYVTLSAWADAMLSDIMQPYVQLKEPQTGVELCQLHLDTFESGAKRSHKCIIMARFYKSASGGWSVTTVGRLCQGNTSDGGMTMAEGCRAVV